MSNEAAERMKSRYHALTDAVKEEHPEIPQMLYAALGTTAANALYLYFESVRTSNVGMFQASLLLFDSADEIYSEWKRDPETWRAI